MATKTIAEMSDDEIEIELSNTSLRIEKKASLIRELSARYADKIMGNVKPDPYFRNFDDNIDNIRFLQAESIFNSARTKNTTSEIPINTQSLQVFLCHSSDDKPAVRELYHRLINDGINPWLDEENLLPGQDWQIEIPKAVRNSDIVIVCLSKKSITKAGYIQKEIKHALDVADEQPEGTIYIIPIKLEECDVPERLRRWQWVNLFDDNGYRRLINSLTIRAKTKNNL